MAKKSLIAKCKRGSRFGVRRYNRCKKCGRRRAFMRKFQLCRICFREMAVSGLIPGVIKASW